MKINQRKAGVILSYTSEGIKIASGLLYTPIMLRLLGQSEYGLYQLVYSVVSYLNLLSLGFGSAYMRFYSRFNEADDQEGVARLNGMFMTIFCVISAICICCGIVMVKNVETIFGDGLTIEELDTARILMALMVFNLALTFPNTVFNCNVTAHERFFFQKLLIIGQNVLNPFLTLPLLLLGFGSISMVCITTCITITKLILDIWYCVSKLKIRFIFNGFQFLLFKEMWIFTFFIFLNQIIDQINWSIDKFLLGRLSGTVAVAVYGVGAQINTMYLQFSTSISSVFVPKVNKIVASTNNKNELTTLFVKIGRIQFMVMILILSGFIFFGHPFICYWAGTEYKESYYVTLLLIIPVTVPLIQNLGIEIQRAMNKHKTRSVVYFLIAIINVFISIPLIKILGPTGAALGTAIGLFTGNILFMNWYYHFRIGINIKVFWKSICSFIPALIVPCAVGIIMMCFVEFKNIFMLFVGISVYTIIYSIFIWFFGMNDDEKAILLVPLKKYEEIK